jgi:ABC-type Fe3+ transport system permease subunit
MPLLACGALLSLIAGALLPVSLVRRWPASSNGTWTLTSRGMFMVTVASVIILGGLVAPPLVRLLLALPSGDDALRAWHGGLRAVGNSLMLSAMTAVVAVGIGWLASAAVVRCSRRALIAWVALLLLPLMVPASAFGIAWAQLTSLFVPWLASLTAASPVLCLVARLAGPATLFLAVARLGIPAETLEAAAIQDGRASSIERLVVLPHLAPFGLAAVGLLGALALNQVEILVLTVPPGFEVLPLRTDNLLHYGLPEEATLLALTTALAAVLPAFAMIVLARVLRRRGVQC